MAVHGKWLLSCTSMKMHVAPNSDSVNSSGDSKVDEAAQDDVLAANNNFDLEDQLADATLKSAKSESELFFYAKGVKSEDEDDLDIIDEDYVRDKYGDFPINIDVQFPPGTSLSIEYKHTFEADHSTTDLRGSE